MKVLIADDSAVMRKMVIRELAELNITEENIVQAADGQLAVEAVSKDSFSLILMDWNMPNMLGIDAVKAIRASGDQTPIIMVTTEAERSQIITAIQAGATNYLAKPFSGADFQEKILQVIPDLRSTYSGRIDTESTPGNLELSGRIENENTGATLALSGRISTDNPPGESTHKLPPANAAAENLENTETENDAKKIKGIQIIGDKLVTEFED